MLTLEPITNTNLSKFDIHNMMLKLGDKIKDKGGVMGGTPECQEMCPLKETFAEGIYIREIFMPKGTFVVTKIHKHKSPYFILRGDCSVMSEDGSVERITQPRSGMTMPGTQRLIYMHEDTVWITCHANSDNEQDTKLLEDRIIIKPKELTEGEL